MIISMDRDERLVLNAGMRAVKLDRFRLSMAAMGYPIDDTTDSEIEAVIDRISKAAASAGVPFDQVMNGLLVTAAIGANYPH